VMARCSSEQATQERPDEGGRRQQHGNTLVASPFLQTEAVKPALHGRKNGAATSHPPIACGFMRRTRTFPPPMRRHAACSGCPWRSRPRFVGKRRAGAPPTALSTPVLAYPRRDLTFDFHPSFHT